MMWPGIKKTRENLGISKLWTAIVTCNCCHLSDFSRNLSSLIGTGCKSGGGICCDKAWAWAATTWACAAAKWACCAITFAHGPVSKKYGGIDILTLCLSHYKSTIDHTLKLSKKITELMKELLKKNEKMKKRKLKNAFGDFRWHNCLMGIRF